MSIPRPTVELILAELRLARKRAGLSMEQLAARLDTSVPTLSRWLRGQGLSLDALDDIARCLGTDLRDLIEGALEESVDRFSLRQERILAADRELSLIFFLVLNGAQHAVLEQDLRLTPAHLADRIDRLIRLGLVRRTAGGRLRPTVSRLVRWRRGGPLATAYERTVLTMLLGPGFGEAGTHYVSQLVRIDEAGRERLHARFESLCADVLRGAAGTTATPGHSEWSALFMMTRKLDVAQMRAWASSPREGES